MFRVFSKYYDGTRGYTNQITTNLITEITLNENYDKIYKQMACEKIRTFIRNIIKKQSFHRKYSNLDDTIIQKYVEEQFPNIKIIQTEKAIFNNTGYLIIKIFI